MQLSPLKVYFMLKNCDKIMHLRFNFDACPMHSPFGFVHLTHQNLSPSALFCHNSLAKLNTRLLIYYPSRAGFSNGSPQAKSGLPNLHVWPFVCFKIHRTIGKSCLLGPWESVFELSLVLHDPPGYIFENP